MTQTDKLKPAPTPEPEDDIGNLPLELDRRKPKLAPEPEPVPAPENETAPAIDDAEEEQLDEEEREFRAIRRDLPGVKGAAGAGIVAISVGKAPTKNEFFRTHPTFRPIVPVVDHEVGMERTYFAVTADMVEPLAAIGITVADHVLYLTVTARGMIRIVPVRQANADGEQNEYNRTKELGLIEGIEAWRRLYTDQENRCYKVFPAPVGRFDDPQWPDLKPAKIFKLAFRDKGRLIDSTEHPLFKKWAARDSE
jgi:hypothetical protein